MTTLDELLRAYLAAGDTPAREGTKEDADGATQRALKDLTQFVTAQIAAETEACAKLMELKRADLLLLAGEMTAQEVRTVQAVLTNRAAVIRRRMPSDSSLQDGKN